MLAWLAVALLGAGPSQDALKIALSPQRSPEEMAAAYAPLADRLEKQLGTPVQLLIATDFGAAITMLADGRADVAELSAYGFVRGMEGHKLQPLVADALSGVSGTGVIVSRSDSALLKLDQLKGSKFAFVDPLASTGYLGPFVNMQVRGVDPASLHARFAGTDAGVLRLISAGEVAAGAVSRRGYDEWIHSHPRGPDAIDPFRVLAETSRMPGDVFCAREQLPAPEVEALTQVLLSLSWEADRKVLEPMGRRGYQRVSLKDYSWLLRVAGTAQAHP